MGMILTVVAGDDFKSPIIEFLDGISDKELGKCLAYMRILQDEGPRLPSQFTKHIVDDIWELRPEFGGVEMRLFYFIWVDDLVVIVHAVKKKGQKTKPGDIVLARRRAREVKDGEANLIHIFP